MVQKEAEDLPLYCDLVCLRDADAVCGREKLSHLVKVQMRQDLFSVSFLHFLLTPHVHQSRSKQ